MFKKSEPVLPPPPGMEEEVYVSPKSRLPLYAGLGVLGLGLAGAGIFCATKFLAKESPETARAEAPPRVAPITPTVASAILPTVAAPDYGSPLAGAPGLEGRFFDLQRKPDGSKIEEPKDMAAAVAFADDFIAGKMTADECARRYLSAPKTLSAARFSAVKATNATVRQAFGMPKDEPTNLNAWAVVYRGRVKAPFTGKFQFVGHGVEDILVRFDGKAVLEGYRKSMRTSPKIKASYSVLQLPSATTGGSNEVLRGGVGVKVEKDQVYDIEIALLHTNSGSRARYMLGYRLEGPEGTAEDGTPDLRLFRVVAEPPGPAEGLVATAPGLVFDAVR